MDQTALINMLTAGLAPDQAAIVRAAIERETVKSGVAALRQAQEYADLEARLNALNLELSGEGDPAKGGKLGLREYQKWYEQNIAAVLKNRDDLKAYTDKYGDLTNPNPNSNPNPNPNPGPTLSMTPAQIAAEVDKRIQEIYSPRWSQLVMGVSDIHDKHKMNKRTNHLDIGKISELAQSKYNGDLMLAYDEWDKPEAEKVTKDATEAEITRRVNEEMAKRGTQAHFPGNSEPATPGTLASKTKEAVDKFDKRAMLNDLAGAWQQAGASS